MEGVFFSYELERDEGQELVTVKSAPNKGFWDGGVTYNSTNDGSPKGIPHGRNQRDGVLFC